MQKANVSHLQQILAILCSQREFHVMIAVYRILSVLLIFALSLLIVRIGSIAFRMTGLSPDVASFQSVSAFSGAGYTTEEAEQTVSMPKRRKTEDPHPSRQHWTHRRARISHALVHEN